MGTDREDLSALAEASTARVAAWLATMSEGPMGDSGATAGAGGAAPGAPGANARPDVLEGVRQNADGFDFTRRLLETVVGASDPFAAALNLREVSRELPESMPAIERLAVRVGGIASLGLPWAVLPVARRWLGERLSHLVLLTRVPGDAQKQEKVAELRASLRSFAGEGVRTTVALCGADPLGADSAERELHRLIALVEQPEVMSVCVDVARLVPETQAGAWALDRDVERGSATLRELFERAQQHGASVMLESSDYRGALLAPGLLVRALSEPGLERLRAGAMLPAELPESVQAAQALILVSRSRVAAGAEPLEIAIGDSVAVGREQIDSILSGLAVPALEDLALQQAQLLRVLRLLLDAGGAVRVVAVSDDVLLLAAATLLAERAGRADALTLQLRAGTATGFEEAMLDHGFAVRRRLPLAAPREFDGLIGYLLGLAAESANPDSGLARTRALLAGERDALPRGAALLAESLALALEEAQPSRRVQHRDQEWSEAARDTAAFYRPPAEPARVDTGGLTAAVLALTRAHTGEIGLEPSGAPLRLPVVSATGFANEPDTDGSRYENRVWVRELLARAQRSDIGIEAVRRASIEFDGSRSPGFSDSSQSSSDDASDAPAAPTASARIEMLIEAALAAAEPWGAARAAERGTRISRLALAAASARDRLVEVLAAESGAPIAVIDRQVNGAIDAARYLGQLAGGLGALRGASFQPDRLALVVAGESVPFAECAEAMLAALAAGSAVLLIAHPSVARSSAVLLEEWAAAGLPEGLASLAVARESEHHEALAVQFAADARVERAFVLGRRGTAEALLRRRPELRVEARFRAPGVVLVAPSADPERAARGAVASAFACGHGDPRAARVLVLLGTAARSRRLRRAIVDAVRSLSVGDVARSADGDPLAFELGPLASPPGEAGLRALTELDPGEQWLVRPERLDDEGRLWRPGVRTGVKRGARFWHEVEGVPVIGVISAQTVDEAISLVNELGGGGVAGLFANDPVETLPWLERVHAASLAVGRPTTDVRVERQPDGGWGSAGLGSAILSGGPSRLLSLGSWELREGTVSSTLHLRGLKPEVRVLIETAQSSLEYQSFDRVRRAALADALAWRTQLGGVHDVSGLGIERNLLRRWPVGTHVRLSEGAPLAALVRVLAAGFVAGAPMSVSTGVVLPSSIGEYLTMQGVAVALERDEAWLERIAVDGPGDDGIVVSRVRLIGGDRVRTAEWLGGLGEISLWAEAVTMAGPIELLAFLREQSVSIAAHRHGLAVLPVGIGGWIAELQSRV